MRRSRKEIEAMTRRQFRFVHQWPWGLVVAWLLFAMLLPAPQEAQAQVQPIPYSRMCILWLDSQKLGVCAPVEYWSPWLYTWGIELPFQNCELGNCITPGGGVAGNPYGFRSEGEAVAYALSKNPYFTECGAVTRESEDPPMTNPTISSNQYYTATRPGIGGRNVEYINITYRGAAKSGPGCVHPRLYIYRFRTAQCPDGYASMNWHYDYNGNGTWGVFWDAKALKEPDSCWMRPPSQPTNLGPCPAPYTMSGAPIHAATGNKYESATDFSDPRGKLSFARSYNSQSGDFRGMGRNWRHNFQRSIYATSLVTPPVAMVERPDGKTLSYRKQADGSYVTDIDVSDVLVETKDALGSPVYTLRTRDDEIETFDSSGRLVTIDYPGGMRVTMTYAGGLLSRAQDSYGRQLDFIYNDDGDLLTVIDPSGAQYSYTYDASRQLVRVTYPGGTSTGYVYNELANLSNIPQTGMLTGIVDENGIRYATFGYSASGRAISSERAGGMQRTTLVYNADGTTTLSDSVGNTRTLTFRKVSSETIRESSADQPSSACGGGIPKTTLYDANGNVSGTRDFIGNGTNFGYDPTRNLETWRVEGWPSDQRMTTTTWHPTLRMPATITEPVAGGNRVTTFVYDAAGNLVSRTVTAPRNDGTSGTLTQQWTWTYSSIGQKLTDKDPNNNVTTYTYYPVTDPNPGRRGALATITNAVGHVTTYSTYDDAGRPTSIVDPNGVTTTLSYSPRGWLTSRSVAGETTSYAYDAAGQLTRVTSPSGSQVNYQYDPAHRLTQVSDTLGNKVTYTLDGMGNRIKQDTYDSGGVLTQTRSSTFDALSQLAQTMGAASQTTAFTYDAAGRRTTTTDPLMRKTTSTYDALNRLTQMLNPLDGVTGLAYDAAGNLSSVLDPRGLTTTYVFDGLGNRIKITSPDTGVTTTTYDAIGNALTQTDARGATATRTLDSLGRTTSIAYSKSGTPTETVAFYYDTGTYGKGRLARVVDNVATTNYTYTAQGRVSSKSQTISAATLTMTFGYDATGQLATMTTPSGQTISYTYLNDRVLSVKVNSTTIVAGIVTTPTGENAAWQWGNGLYSLRYFDTDGHMNSWTFRNGMEVLRNDLTHDAAGRITAIANPGAPTASATYQYDLVDRLTVVRQGNPTAQTTQFTYDAIGNRTTANVNGSAATFSYPASSSRLQNITGGVSANHLNGFTDLGYAYNNANRLAQVSSGGVPIASYAYNGRGQRVQKTVAGVITRYVYDAAGHLVGEYDSAGQLIQETVWLDDLPIATLRPTGTGVPTPIAIYYVHVDHLGTPRAVTRPSDNAVMWRWDNLDAFGANPANENPTGQGTFRYALRFPGQYYDPETGSHYNYFRDYEPRMGRYVQSDPIGLKGGPNTFAYVESMPTSRIDALGLFSARHHRAITREALRLEPCRRQGERIVSMTVFADYSTYTSGWSQQEMNSYQHCMRSPVQTVAEARRLWRGFVTAGLGNCSGDLVGSALHAIQDCSARGHRGFQVWEWKWTWPIVPPEHSDADETPTDAELQEAIDSTVDGLRLFKANCPCACR